MSLAVPPLPIPQEATRKKDMYTPSLGREIPSGLLVYGSCIKAGVMLYCLANDRGTPIIVEVPVREYVKIAIEENKKAIMYLRARSLVEYSYIRFGNIDSYIETYPELLRLRGKKILVLFSGGKDSVLQYKTLERIGANIEAVYVHLPYFEDLLMYENSRIYDKLDVKIIEIPREKVEQYIRERGWVTAKWRWCSGLKFKAVKQLREKYPDALISEGTRMWESRERRRRLIHKSLINPRKVYPILHYTNGDAYAIASKYGLLSPMYRYSTRTSCTLCPFDITPMRVLRYHEFQKKLPEVDKRLRRILGDDEYENIVFRLPGIYKKTPLYRIHRRLAEFPEVSDNKLRQLWMSELERIIGGEPRFA